MTNTFHSNRSHPSAWSTAKDSALTTRHGKSHLLTNLNRSYYVKKKKTKKNNIWRTLSLMAQSIPHLESLMCKIRVAWSCKNVNKDVLLWSSSCFLTILLLLTLFELTTDRSVSPFTFHLPHCLSSSNVRDRYAKDNTERRFQLARYTIIAPKILTVQT